MTEINLSLVKADETTTFFLKEIKIYSEKFGDWSPKKL